jgi:hypothetical protein
MNYKTFLTFVCLIWYTLPVHAQTTTDCTDISLPKHYNIVVAYDADCIDIAGSEAEARDDIKLKMNEAINRLNQLFDPFNLDFKVVLFPLKQYPNQLSRSDAALKVHADFFCVPYDGLVFFQGDPPQASHAVGTTAMINFGSASASLITHEIGHLILGGHQDNTPCGASCTDDFLSSNFMCEDGDNMSLTACQVNALNTVFFPTRCNALLDDTDILPDDFECPVMPRFSITADQKYLMRGCDKDRSNVMLNLTVTGGSLPATVSNVKARFQDRVYDFDLASMGMDFNKAGISPINNDATELRQLVDPSGPFDGPSKTFTVQPGESKVFMFKLKYNPDDSTIFLTSSILAATVAASVKVTVEQAGGLPTLMDIIERKVILRPVMPYNPSGPFAGGAPIMITQDINIPVNSGVPFNWNAPLTLVKPGVGITVQSGAHLFMDLNIPMTIEGCGGMWNGIRVNQNGRLTLDEVTVQDALVAVNVRPQAKEVSVTNTIFENNEVGVQVEGTATTAPLLSGLDFRQSAELKAKPTAQNPNPNKFSLLGIKAIDAGNLSVSIHPIKGYGAHFEGLRDGVFAKNTNLEVSNSTFFNLMPEGPRGGTGVIGSGGTVDIMQSSFMNCKTGIRASSSTLIALSNTFFDMQDTAISANRSSLQITGNNIFNGQGGILAKNCGGFVKTNIINNARCGVRVDGSVLNVEDNTITGGNITVNNVSVGNTGIIGTLNGGLVVRKNVINATNFGISFYHGNQFYGVPVVEENTITMQGNADGIGIASAGTVVLPSNGGRIFNNTIHVLEGNSGIAATVAGGMEVVYNHIDMHQQGTPQFGIRLEEGDRLTVTDNDVTGDGIASAEGEQRGIYGMHTCGSFLSCNYTNNTPIGFNFAGECSAKRPLTLQFNTIRDHELGLLLGIAGNGNAVIGPQVHRENQWAGSYSASGALHLGDAFVANYSKFTADDQLNDDYIPDMYSPVQWFSNEASDGVSYACTRRPGDAAVTDLDIRIAQGAVQGKNDGGALGWMAQRRLYERLAAEGNLGGSLQTFSQWATENKMADYAQRQIAMRTTSLASESERTELAGMDSVLWAQLAALLHARTQRNAATDPAVRAQWQGKMADLSAEMAQQRAKKANFLADLGQQRAQKAQQELALPTLDGSEVYKTNERVVHRIRMAQYFAPDGALTPAQVAELTPIAQQCPLLGGDAVLWARILIQQQSDAPIVYPDDQTCRPAERGVEGRSASPATHPSERLQVTPNPVADQLWLDYTLTNGGTFYLSDATGRNCAAVELAPGQNRVALPVATLPNGLYHYHIPGLTAGKIIVQH